MFRILSTALVGSLLFPTTATQPSPSVYSIEKGRIAVLSQQQDNIIFETKNRWILKTPGLVGDRDIYFVQLAPGVSVLKTLKTHGQIFDYYEDEFAVWSPKDEKALNAISSQLHEEGGQCGALQKLQFTTLQVDLNQPQPLIAEKDEAIQNVVNSVRGDLLLSGVQTLQDWGSRYHKDSQGVLAGEKLAALYETLTPDDRDDVEIELVTHSGSPQKSVIVRIPGTQDSESIAILGSHLDSINGRNNANAPGADDNASGTATNMEVFRVLMENKIYPQKTIEFHAYAAEEIGLVGSGEIAQTYKDTGKKVMAMVQFDMNGYSKNGERKIFFVSNKTNKSLSKTMGQITDTYVGIDHGSQFLLFGSSDHASWNRLGFPVAFPTENPFAYNRSIHTDGDTMANINVPEQMTDFAKLGVAYVLTFAGY